MKPRVRWSFERSDYSAQGHNRSRLRIMILAVAATAVLGIIVPVPAALPTCGNSAIRKYSESSLGYKRCTCGRQGGVCRNCTWQSQISYVGRCSGGEMISDTCPAAGSFGQACRNYREVFNRWNCPAPTNICYTQRCVRYGPSFDCNTGGPGPPDAPGACNPCITPPPGCAYCTECPTD